MRRTGNHFCIYIRLSKFKNPANRRNNIAKTGNQTSYLEVNEIYNTRKKHKAVKNERKVHRQIKIQEDHIHSFSRSLRKKELPTPQKKIKKKRREEKEKRKRQGVGIKDITENFS